MAEARSQSDLRTLPKARTPLFLPAAPSPGSGFAETPLAPFGDASSAVLLGIAQQAWRRELSYDPASDLSTLEQPMLVILGGADQDVPTAKVAAGFRRDVPPRSDAVRLVLIIPGVNHYLLRPGDANASASDSAVDQFDPELFTTPGQWLDARKRRIGSVCSTSKAPCSTAPEQRHDSTGHSLAPVRQRPLSE